MPAAIPPLSATIDFIRRHPAAGGNAHMGPMHWRTLLGIEPRYADSVHIVQNERVVTRFAGEYRGGTLPFYVVQIGALTVSGIDTYYRPGERVERGAAFGMIRVGSQVDLIVPWREGLRARVKPGTACGRARRSWCSNSAAPPFSFAKGRAARKRTAYSRASRVSRSSILRPTSASPPNTVPIRRLRR